MIEIFNTNNEWCTCCQKQTSTKRIKFSQDGRQGMSVVLCDNCRKELRKGLEEQKPILDKIKQEMEELIQWHDCPIELDNGNDAMYCNAVERCIKIIDKYRQEEKNNMFDFFNRLYPETDKDIKILERKKITESQGIAKVQFPDGIFFFVCSKDSISTGLSTLESAMEQIERTKK